MPCMRRQLNVVLCPYSFLSLQDKSNVFHLCAAGGNVAIAQFMPP